jgi:beta-lactamase regulating signal transducer with metallopeptidase domain
VWKAFTLLVLALTALAWLGPHLRFVSPQLVLGNPRAGDAWSWQQPVYLGLVWLWGAGVILGLISLVLGIVASLGDLRATVPCGRSQLGTLPTSETEMLDGTAGVEFRTSITAPRPYCWQFSRPVIVLPCPLLQAPADILRPIVLHELAHLRANHPLHLFLQHVVEILFWYHPAIWQAARRANLQRELVADYHAVASREEAVHYLRGLLLMSKRNDSTHGLPVGLALLGSRSEIQERVKRLVERTWEQIQPARQWSQMSNQLLVAASCLLVWIPLDPASSSRSMWSPWPEWTAVALHAMGISVRDYEIDSHRLVQHHTHGNSVN